VAAVDLPTPQELVALAVVAMVATGTAHHKAQQERLTQAAAVVVLVAMVNQTLVARVL
jgi:hypothetical protein